MAPSWHRPVTRTGLRPPPTLSAIDRRADPRATRSVERFASGAPWEAIVGYSRAVRAGPWVFVAGTTGTVEGSVVAPGDAYAQTLQALHNVDVALRLAGATLDDVVQTRLSVTDITRWQDVARAHEEVFAGAPPVTAMVGVSGLIDPDMLVEVEATAYLGS